MNNETEDDEEYGFELEDESSDGPFAKAYGIELLDKRLSDGEKMLLFWLRFRCGANRQNGGKGFFKYSEIAKDLRLNEKTIRNRTAVLENLGFLGSKPNGYGRSKIKVIRHPNKIYTATKVNGVFDYLKKGRTDDDLDYVTSVGLEPNANIIPEKPRSTRRNIGILSDDDHESIPEQTCRNDIPEQTCRYDRNKRAGMIGTNLPVYTGTNVPVINRSASEVDQSEIDQLEIDRRSRGLTSDSSVIKNADSHGTQPSDLRIPEDQRPVDDDAIIRANNIASAMTEAMDKTAAAHQKQWDRSRRVSDEKKAERADAKKRMRQNEVNDIQWKWSKIEKLIWIPLFEEYYPGKNRSSWEKNKEGMTAEKMVKDYGIEVVKLALAKFFEQWHFLRQKTFPYKSDPAKWGIADFGFFKKDDAKQFLADIKIEKPKIVNRTVPSAAEKKSGMW